MREAVDRIVWQTRKSGGRDSEWRIVRQDQRSPVRGLLGDVIRGDRSRRTRPVVHYRLLPIVSVEMLGQKPRDEVTCSAWREGDDDPDRFVAPCARFRQGRIRGDRHDREGGGGEGGLTVHWTVPFCWMPVLTPKSGVAFLPRNKVRKRLSARSSRVAWR